VSRAILRWLRDERIETALIHPAKPRQNGSNESFNRKLRDECLGMHWFRNRTEARVVIEQWRREYNEDRPHSSLGGLTPSEFARTQTSKMGTAIF
jgi:putative transposase